MDYIQGLRPYSNKEVNRAGTQLVTPVDAKAFSNAMEVVAGWRTLHEGAVTLFRLALDHVAAGVDSQALIATRLKRIPTIIEKLRRQPTMKLSTMQDIGGLRAVVGTVADAGSLADALRYLRDIMPQFKLRSSKDYIEAPTQRGYRGIHLVYGYESQGDVDRNLNGLRVEVQVRTRLQHIWATAVELVGTFRGESLKSGEGDPDWLEFFRLAGSLIAKEDEGRPTSPTLDPELVTIRDRLNVAGWIDSYRAGLQVVQFPEAKDSRYFVMVLNLENQTIDAQAFGSDLFEQAVRSYRDEEERNINSEYIDTVLVTVESPAELREAYPNYFAEGRDFRNLVYGLPRNQERRS